MTRPAVKRSDSSRKLARQPGAASGRTARPAGHHAHRELHSIATLLCAWFESSARELPWRKLPLGTPRDPYACLVSELMLQQTQVSRVVDRFTAFMRRFPTAPDLARADESDVLAMWSGLGYYRRARHLHNLAKAIVDRFDGTAPTEFDELRSLPGVGRYTAGAVASMSSAQRVGAVDANAIRVFLRLLASDADPKRAKTTQALTEFGDRLAQASDHAGIVNEAVMELGATVCTPARGNGASATKPSPDCPSCPITAHCGAFKTNAQRSIPLVVLTTSARKTTQRAEKRPLHIAAAIIADNKGRVLMRQRSAGSRRTTSMWQGMYELPAIETLDTKPTKAALAREIGVPGASLSLRETIHHDTTHRAVTAYVYSCNKMPAGWQPDKDWLGSVWVNRAKLETLGLSSLHRKIAEVGLKD